MTEAPPVVRRPLVVANWKMYLARSESVRAARTTRSFLARVAGRSVDVVLCPSFPALVGVQEALAGSRLAVGAQDLHAEERGPYTGDVAAAQLAGLARYVILGHSERRRHHGETDELVAAKVRRALRHGLRPIVCVGESAEERDAGETVARLRTSVAAVFHGVPGLSLAHCAVAYEPLWAISVGPGSPSPQPAPEDAAHLLGLARAVLAGRLGRRYAEHLRCLYGGSVDAQTVTAFVREPGVDGVLVGAASITPGGLAAVVHAVRLCRS